jgi:hypothetical protein
MGGCVERPYADQDPRGQRTRFNVREAESIMLRKRTFVTIIAVAALAAFANVSDSRARAQSDVSPPQPDRFFFGMVGITRGQTLRVSVANVLQPLDSNYPPGPTRVALTFLDSEGRRFLSRDGSPIRRTALLDPGHATFLDLDFDEFPPGPTRLQLRAVVTVTPPAVPAGTVLPPGPIVPSGEIITNANGRTVVFLTNPGVIRGFNPQPDPPLGQ